MHLRGSAGVGSGVSAGWIGLQYRLRVGEVRVFYDVTSEAVEVLAVVGKGQAQTWLDRDRPAGVLIGFETEEDWLEYRMQNDPAFLQRIVEAREAIRAGRGVRIEDIDE